MKILILALSSLLPINGYGQEIWNPDVGAAWRNFRLEALEKKRSAIALRRRQQALKDKEPTPNPLWTTLPSPWDIGLCLVHYNPTGYGPICKFTACEKEGTNRRKNCSSVHYCRPDRSLMKGNRRMRMKHWFARNGLTYSGEQVRPTSSEDCQFYHPDRQSIEPPGGHRSFLD